MSFLRKLGRFFSGRKPEHDLMRGQADAQARLAGTQEDVATRYFGYADEDRGRRDRLAESLTPVVDRLTSDPFAGMARPARPDMTGAFRRNLADEQAGIQEDQNRAMAEVADYAAGSGLARTGATGLGLGAIFRGADRSRSLARRAYQDDLTGETLAQHDDSVARYEDELERKGAGLDAALAGANIVQGQQAMYDPARSASIATGNLGQAVASRGAAGAGYDASARLPGRWSWLGGLAGGVLNSAAGGGLRNIWRGRQTAAPAAARA